ncbi:MAG: amidohydrolase [Massiliimalia sp.]|jgi:predicted amidohydrolase YtcJ
MKQTIYENGIILTMNEEHPLAEAVLVEDDRILAVGSREQVRQCCGIQCQVRDLQGKTLMPGFIDAHSHIRGFSNLLSTVLLQQAENFQDIQEKLRAKVKTLPAGEWLIGFGYDQNRLVEGTHPTREILDQVSEDHPILAVHQSGHMGAVNSMALKLMGITAETPDPVGGKIGRKQDGTPNGYLEEAAFTLASKYIPTPTGNQREEQLKQAEEIYLRYGITTVQDGLTDPEGWSFLKKMALDHQLSVDVVCYADLKNSKELYRENRDYMTYQHHLKMGGYKLFLDGSPQGKTAWLTRPYEGSEDRGYPVYSDEQVTSFFEQALEDNAQILVHCNGDAAAQQMISCYSRAKEKFPDRKIRPVMIHAQLVRPDQLEVMGKLGMIASFFVAHTYYWGDIHLKNLGQDRGNKISPVKSAINYGVPYTFHQDSPVLFPDMMKTVWCAVNRKTQSGKVLDQSQCLSTWEALKGITINSAYQYFEEDQKGTIEPGKLADFVLLDRNPLDTPKEELDQIQVLETIKQGNTVWKME